MPLDSDRRPRSRFASRQSPGIPRPLHAGRNPAAGRR